MVFVKVPTSHLAIINCFNKRNTMLFKKQKGEGMRLWVVDSGGWEDDFHFLCYGVVERVRTMVWVWDVNTRDEEENYRKHFSSSPKRGCVLFSFLSFSRMPFRVEWDGSRKRVLLLLLLAWQPFFFFFFLFGWENYFCFFDDKTEMKHSKAYKNTHTHARIVIMEMNRNILDTHGLDEF